MVATLRGYSLAEVILSLAFFSATILAVLAVFGYGLRLSTLNRGSNQAALLASRLFEAMREVPLVPGSYTGGAASAGFPPAPYPQVDIEGTRYRLEVQAEAVVGQPGLFQVTTQIRWGEQHQASFSTRVYRP